MRKNQSAADQWGVPEAKEQEKAGNKPTSKVAPDHLDQAASNDLFFADFSFSDRLRRRGFFEAISVVECPLEKMSSLLKEYRDEAKRRMEEIDSITDTQIRHYLEQIDACHAKLNELKQEKDIARQYKEADDADLQKLIEEKKQQESELEALQTTLTKIRIRLGEAKAGIINKSLDEAEEQVKKALNIQELIYDRSFALNKQQFTDEKDHLTRLAKYYELLYEHYKDRYEKIKKHLNILDADGISKVTTVVLTHIGSLSFVAAGFFFSVFASATTFGNQDIFQFILGGLFDTANNPLNWAWKILILLGLVVVITGISMACHILIENLNQRNEKKNLNEFWLSTVSDKKFKDIESRINLKSNSWMGFWVQLIPLILIVCLVILGISKNNAVTLNEVNSSSEGLIVGTMVAMSLAGLVYLYIIKIVEPRVIKKREEDPHIPVNWLKANWELVLILLAFLLFAVCIIIIPYDASKNLIPDSMKARYAVLLFIGISLVGSISFAYGARSRGLIDTSHFLERVMSRLNNWISLCTAPVAPALPAEVEEKHRNILQHVLKQLTFNATVNKSSVPAPAYSQKPPDNPFAQLVNWVIRKSPKEKKAAESVQNIIIMEPWEERYFPQFVDEIKAIEFEYKEKKLKTKKLEDEIDNYKSVKETERCACGTEINNTEKDVTEKKQKIVDAQQEQANQHRKITVEYEKTTNSLLDGFHLGIWYRENKMGPTPEFYRSCNPTPPLPPALPLLLPITAK